MVEGWDQYREDYGTIIKWLILGGKETNSFCLLLPRETVADAKKELSSPSSVNRSKEKIKMITYV